MTHERRKCSICGAPFAGCWTIRTIGPQTNYCVEHYDELFAVRKDPFTFEARRRRLLEEFSGSSPWHR
jgi:hypothetical protein